MARSVDDIPFPPRRPRKQKSDGKSGGGNGTTVGMAIVLFGSMGTLILTAVGYIVWGYLA